MVIIDFFHCLLMEFYHFMETTMDIPNHKNIFLFLPPFLVAAVGSSRRIIIIAAADTKQTVVLAVERDR